MSSSIRMRYRLVLLILIFVVTLLSCRKENRDDPPNPPPSPQIEKKVLLKDITIPHLPSPYYHFEYNSDSLCTKANFADKKICIPKFSVLHIVIYKAVVERMYFRSTSFL